MHLVIPPCRISFPNHSTLSVPSQLAQLSNRRIYIMLRWALGFLLLAVIAAVLGFGGIATFAVEIAKFLFVIFVILFVIALISGKGSLKL